MKIHWNTEKPKNHVYRSTNIYKTPKNITDQKNSHKIYTSIARMYSNEEFHRRDYGDSSQLANWIFDSSVT